MEGMEGTNMSSIRILRVFRLIRTFRIIRVVNVFRSLRLMVCCIFNSLMSLMWAQLDLQYRSVIRALMTLLMCIAGGIDWYEAVRPLMLISPVYAAFFSAYIVFVLFGVLNVLSAVFVEQ